MGTSASEVVSIKRYPNRRLYDRQARRYITLQDLEDLVLGGKQIEVRESRTGEDLTRSILTQILLERHPEKMELFPVAMLHGILRANDLVLDFLRSYMRQSLAILEQMQQPTRLAPFLAPMDWMRAMIPPTLPFPAVRPAESSFGSGRHGELDVRISEIEERLRRLEQPSQRIRKDGPSPPSDQPHTAEEESASLDLLEQRLSELENGTSHSTKRGTG
ncbi:MAG: polyhydroxyalkanoate synthesis regulator DNA-binding domain-containing protein [Isosphaeraceae bacterium]